MVNIGGIDPAKTRWPASASYALNEWPGARNVGLAGSGCTPCGSKTLGFGAPAAPSPCLPSLPDSHRARR